MTFLYICAWVTSDVVRCKQPQSDLLYTEQLCWSGRVKGLAQRRLSGAGESGASAAFHFSPPSDLSRCSEDLKQRPSGHKPAPLTFIADPEIDFHLQRWLFICWGWTCSRCRGNRTPRTSWLVHDPLCKCSILVWAEQCAKKNPLVWGNYWAFSKNKTMCSWPAFKD